MSDGKDAPEGQDDPEGALALIREIHKHPRRLTPEEVAEWLLAIPNLGRPELRRGRRGPPSRKSQYDDALAWRRRVARAIKQARGRALTAERTRLQIERALASVPASTPRHRLCTAVASVLDRAGGLALARTTIARHLRALGRL